MDGVQVTDMYTIAMYNIYVYIREMGSPLLMLGDQEIYNNTILSITNFSILKSSSNCQPKIVSAFTLIRGQTKFSKRKSRYGGDHI